MEKSLKSKCLTRTYKQTSHTVCLKNGSDQLFVYRVSDRQCILSHTPYGKSEIKNNVSCSIRHNMYINFKLIMNVIKAYIFYFSVLSSRSKTFFLAKHFDLRDFSRSVEQIYMQTQK